MQKNPLPLRIISWVYPRIEAISPSLAGSWAKRLFFTPIPYKVKPEELKFRNTGLSRKVFVGKHKIQTYEWGSGPVILAIHGWSGRGTQFMHFVDKFVREGFKVVCIDAPAHGQSSGRKTDVLEFAESIKQVARSYEKVEGVIAHSLGGVASLIAIDQGLKIEKLVLVSMPTIASLIMAEFEKQVKAQRKSTNAIHKHVQNKYDRNFSEFFPPTVKADLRGIDLMVAHDLDDVEVPVCHAELLRDLYPNAHYHYTSGLGHYRILRDNQLVQKSFEFWQKQSEPHPKMQLTS